MKQGHRAAISVSSSAVMHIVPHGQEDAITTQLSPATDETPRRDPAVAAALARAEEIAAWCTANAAAIDHEGAFPLEEFRLLAEADLLAAPLPREFGGLGLGLGTEAVDGGAHALLLLLKALGRGNLAVGRVYEGHVNALQLIQLFGTPE